MNPTSFEHIEAYLDGNITKQELEAQLTPDQLATLEEDIEWLKNSRIAVQAEGLRQQLKETLPKAKNKETKVVSFYSNKRQLYWIAASLVVLFVAFWGVYINDQSSLYEKHLYKDPGLPVLMSQSEQYQLYDAMSFYSEGNYVVAAQKLKTLQEETGATDTTNYYLGASLLYQDKPNEAIPYLNEVSEANSAFKQKSEWLLLLAYIKDEQLEEAKASLSNILSNEQHLFYKEAQELSQELD